MSNDLSQSIPMPTLVASGSSNNFENSTPMWTVEATGVQTGLLGSMTTPMPTLSATGVTGGGITASLTIPMLVLDAGTGGYALLEVPAPTLTATLLTGGTGVGNATLPAITLEASGTTENILAAALTIPTPTLSASLTTAGLGSLSLTIPMRTLTAAGLTGELATADLTIPVIVLVAEGYPEGTATASLTAPTWQLTATAWATITEAYRAWALNTRKEALTEYDSFEFNSLAVFKGRVLAAGTSGIVELADQDDDDGTAIAARIVTGQSDFDTSYVKRVPRVYVGGTTNGPLEVRTITTQDGARVYILPYNGNPDQQQRRVPVGRGPRSRFWQYEVRNREGADFTLDDLQVYPERTGRRVI